MTGFYDALETRDPELRERERHKMAELAQLLAEALRGRGVTEPAATLAGESGATVFGIAFAAWISISSAVSTAASLTRRRPISPRWRTR